jgi:two-component system, chemotaxis family, sensor kinase CheA
MSAILKKLVLPKQVSDFEARYLKRINRISLIFFAMHLPVFVLIALVNDTRPLRAAILTGLVLIGPTVAYFTLSNLRAVSVVYGITAMFMGGLLVHFGQGPVQIEMHFYFFALIAMLAVYGNPMVILAAAVTVALHHLILWFILPSSVFNYEAQIWVVAIHAAFVVLESVATCFIARSFFDNVIGLEKIVQARTAELDGRNRDMRLVLDNVVQGFMTIDRDGVLSSEHSAIVEQWLGVPTAGMTLVDLLARRSPEFAARVRSAWAEVIEDVMPLELTILQMPAMLTLDERHLRFEYKPLLQGDRLEKALVVISDITAEFQRARSEAERRQSMSAFERMSSDRAGFLEFLEEGTALVEAITSERVPDGESLKRMVHTLKGNCAIFGVEAASELCHEMETRMVEERVAPLPNQVAQLGAMWSRMRADVERLAGSRRSLIELDEEQYRDLLALARDAAARAVLQRKIEELPLEPTRVRLERIGEQARRIVRRLSKGEIDLAIEDHDLRLDPKRWSAFWSAFIHAVRNAADHGLETSDERASAGKSERGLLSLRTLARGNKFVVEIEDDGRGIDWEAVRRAASAKGLPTETADDLTNALLCASVTTREVVTTTSGRGVGLAAVRQRVDALGGHIKLATALGQGTLFQLTFPLDPPNSPHDRRVARTSPRLTPPPATA